MSIVNMDDRGRVTLPPEIRSQLGTKTFIAHLEKDGIHLIPLPDPTKIRGSLKIPWTNEELEEAAEADVLRRA